MGSGDFMDKNLSCRQLFASGVMLLASLLFFIPFANSESFVEGVHYQPLPIPVSPADVSKIEVVEVFSYACIHCKNFDPILEEWAKQLPEELVFTRTPAIFNQTWATLAQAYYAAAALGVGSKVHSPMFRAIHDQGVDLRRPDRLATLFEREAGVDPQLFDRTFNSFGVRNLVNQAEAKGRAYRVTGVPSLIIGGKYRVDARMAGSAEGMIEVAEHLIEKILLGKTGSKD